MVAGWKLSHRFDAELKLLRPQPQIERTLKLTQILPLIAVFDEDEAAVASF